MTPSLASSMYLMVLYFITGAYQDVFRMVESCVSEELIAEEVSCVLLGGLRRSRGDFLLLTCSFPLTRASTASNIQSVRVPWK